MLLGLECQLVGHFKTMKNILAKGGIEFLAVFLGIVLSLWVDDYRESKELDNRLNDDYKKILTEVNANIKNINEIIDANKKYSIAEDSLIDILNDIIPYNLDLVIKLIKNSSYTPTFFGRTSAYNASISSGRFNASKRENLVDEISLLYEHYLKRLKLNGDLFDTRGRDFEKDYAMPFFKARFNQTKIDEPYLKIYFFSKEFHNGLLYLHDFRTPYYIERLNDAHQQLLKVQKTLEKIL